MGDPPPQKPKPPKKVRSNRPSATDEMDETKQGPQAQIGPLNIETRREACANLSHYMLNSPSRYQTIMLPERLLAVMCFPLKEQEAWIATHKSKGYSIQTGVCEGVRERTASMLTLRDFDYFAAVLSLVQNTPAEPKDIHFTLRHLAYIMNGYPKLNGKLYSLNIGGRFGREFGRALEKLSARHIRYTAPQNGSTSSAPMEESFLKLLDYNTHEQFSETHPTAIGKTYWGIQTSPGFDALGELSWAKFDLLMYFSVGNATGRAIMLKLMPRLLAGRYGKKDGPKTLKVAAESLLTGIGQSPEGSYLKPFRIKQILELPIKNLNGVTGCLGTKFKISLKQSTDGKLWVHASLDYTEKNREEQEHSLRKTESYKLWTQTGARGDEFIRRIFDGRTAAVAYDDLDKEEVERTCGLNTKGMEGYLTLVKQLVGKRGLYQAVADFNVAAKTGNAALTDKALTGFLKTEIVNSAKQSERFCRQNSA